MHFLHWSRANTATRAVLAYTRSGTFAYQSTVKLLWPTLPIKALYVMHIYRYDYDLPTRRGGYQGTTWYGTVHYGTTTTSWLVQVPGTSCMHNCMPFTSISFFSSCLPSSNDCQALLFCCCFLSSISIIILPNHDALAARKEDSRRRDC